MKSEPTVKTPPTIPQYSSNSLSQSWMRVGTNNIGKNTHQTIVIVPRMKKASIEKNDGTNHMKHETKIKPMPIVSQYLRKSPQSYQLKLSAPIASQNDHAARASSDRPVC